MDLRKLKKLIDLVEESGIAELEITEGEEKVRIVKSTAAPLVAAAAVAPPLHLPPAAVQTAAPAPEQVETVHEGHPVKSPMVGTF